LRDAGGASLRLVSELSGTIARDRELAKSVFEPGTYVADGSFVFVRNPSLDELARSRRLMVAEIGPDVAYLEVLARVCARNPMAWWLIMRAADDSRDGAEPVGFCGYLPLNADGFAALKAGALRARDPDLSLIAPRGEDPVALYLWAIVAHGLSDIAGKLVGHAIGLDLYESLPMFGTIGTEAGLAALRRSSKSASDAAALKIGSIFEIKLPQKHIEHQRTMRVWEGRHVISSNAFTLSDFTCPDQVGGNNSMGAHSDFMHFQSPPDDAQLAGRVRCVRSDLPQIESRTDLHNSVAQPFKILGRTG